MFEELRCTVSSKSGQLTTNVIYIWRYVCNLLYLILRRTNRPGLGIPSSAKAVRVKSACVDGVSKGSFAAH